MQQHWMTREEHLFIEEIVDGLGAPNEEVLGMPPPNDSGGTPEPVALAIDLLDLFGWVTVAELQVIEIMEIAMQSLEP